MASTLTTFTTTTATPAIAQHPAYDMGARREHVKRVPIHNAFDVLRIETNLRSHDLGLSVLLRELGTNIVRYGHGHGYILVYSRQHVVVVNRRGNRVDEYRLLHAVVRANLHQETPGYGYGLLQAAFQGWEFEVRIRGSLIEIDARRV